MEIRLVKNNGVIVDRVFICDGQEGDCVSGVGAIADNWITPGDASGGSTELKIMNYEAQFVLSSLDVEINSAHMKFIRDLCEDFEYEDEFDDIDYGGDHEVFRIMNLEPRDVFQDTSSEERKGNCKRALEIIDGIMGKDNKQMDQGEYL